LNNKGRLFSAGSNHSGQLGVSEYQGGFTPLDCAEFEKAGGVIKIGAGGCHNAVLTAHGKVFTWGSNDWGQLGIGSQVNQNTPVLINDPLLEASGGVVDIALGDYHTMFLCNDGKVYATGSSNYGQCGILSEDIVLSPIVLSADMEKESKAVKIYAGDDHTFIVYENNMIFSCGLNTAGQLGLGKISPSKKLTLCIDSPNQLLNLLQENQEEPDSSSLKI
jgi:alpha-tubulin suppressor-like RCC1 family protein